MKFNKLIPELYVSSISNSLSFYNKLGFKIEYSRPENKFAFLSLQGSQIMIQELTEEDKEDTIWQTGMLEKPFGRGLHFQIEVKDVKKILNNAREGNYKIKSNLETRWFRKDNSIVGMKFFLITDPDGYLLLFHEDIGKKKIK
jgi:hypothetical protein